MADGEWWITGGENGADTTEKMLELLSDGSDAAPDLPEPKDGHNVVPVDEDTAFITNGATDSSFLYGRSDPEDDGTFTQVEDQGEERYQGFAGLIRKADGTRWTVDIQLWQDVRQFTKSSVCQTSLSNFI